MMSANSRLEMEAVEAISAEESTRKGRPKTRKAVTYTAEAKDRKRMSQGLGSLVAKQFHVLLLRTITGMHQSDTVLMGVGNTTAIGERVDAQIAEIERGLSPETRLWLAVISRAVNDHLGVIDGAHDADEERRIKEEAAMYFWIGDRYCLVRHCILLGLDVRFVRDALERAESYVFDRIDLALAEERKAKARMGRGRRLQWLVDMEDAANAARTA